MKNIITDVVSIKKLLPKNKTFTFIGGGFDLLHVGHLHLLEYASSLEEILVVAVLSDDFIRKNKNPIRPIINQKQRATMLANIKCVDFVYISDVEPNSFETLKLLKPNSVVYSNEKANKQKVKFWTDNIKIISPNTKIHLLPRYNKEKISTSHIVEKIRKISRN